ncbi:MAG: 2,3-bisphosphoglycerate-independent phosphoglycerate mutase [Salinarchaeum sp.]
MDAALVILDGWGIDATDGRNAVATAETPVFDRLSSQGATGTLDVSGRAVGLPEGQMGNSEVGHLTIGAGRVVLQPYARIEDAIDIGAFFENDALQTAIDHVRSTGGRLHLMGLVSRGGVHSHYRHLEALIDLADRADVEAITHAFLDGRDTPPRAAIDVLDDLKATIEHAGTGAVATIAGRYYAMDRDANWERTRAAYDAIVNREADHIATTPQAAVRAAYGRGESDEFVEPTLVDEQPVLADGDAVVFFNFRPDRARQLVRMLTNTEPEWTPAVEPPAIELVTMTQYDETFPFPVAFPPERPTVTLGSVLAEHGLRQLRIAESEKYPHVTYFLNGGRERCFEGELRRIIESPDVPTYDEQPSMSATAVTTTAIDVIAESDPEVLILNYANPDMVGHTGDFDATVAAVETVDRELGRLVDAIDGHILIIADHGNAEDMGTPEAPHTAHTTNPVPVVYLAAATNGQSDRSDGYRIREGGRLCDVTPTLLGLLGIDSPSSMTGESLLL